jgi:hypothetical protein
MRKNTAISFLLLLFPFFCFSQTNWQSSRHNYSIEIPQGFSKTAVVGSNIDFKATNGLSSVVVLVKTIPQEYYSYSILDMIGDLEKFGEEWESGATEYMDNPKFLKYGKTMLSNLETFWFDYTTDNPTLYSKNYQTKKGNKLYTITLSCPKSEYNNYASVWYRFKDKMKID